MIASSMTDVTFRDFADAIMRGCRCSGSGAAAVDGLDAAESLTALDADERRIIRDR